ncbi:hypothetical protein ACLB2K_072541 [Fragaria x ananassa]
MWRLSVPVDVQLRGDRFLFTFNNEHDLNLIWVTIRDLPAALTTDANVRLVGETICSVLQVNQAGLRQGTARVRITLPLQKPLRVCEGNLRFHQRMSSQCSTTMSTLWGGAGTI